MTERTLEVALLLPRDAACVGCVEEVGRELEKVAGVTAVAADADKGVLTIGYDEGELAARDVELLARRAGVQAHCARHCTSAVHDHGRLDLMVPLPDEDGEQRRVLHVTGMDCAECAAKLEGALGNVRGIRAATVSFGAATLAVTFDSSQVAIDGVYAAIRRLGYDTLEGRAARTSAVAGAAPAASPTAVARLHEFWLRDRRAQLTLVAGALLTAGFIAQALFPSVAPWLFAASMIAGGAFVARAAFFGLRARQVDMNTLMTLAALGAAAIGEWSEAALVVTLFSLGTSLQAATLERTRHAIQGLMELAPPRVVLVRDGVEVVAAAAEVVPGDFIVVRPGERLAVDGVVLDGCASANQAPITGEATPVAKAPGDAVFAGSIVEGGSLRVRATTDVSDTTIAKIVHMVEEAQAQRAPLQSIVDRFAARYTPIVVALAAAIALVPPALFGEPFATWFYRGLAVLIIACPCALVISTPVSILAALSCAARQGVLIKGGVFLERAAKVKAVAFDKTGTLTVGRPLVTDVLAFAGANERRVLELAALLERSSEHPLARAIVEASRMRDGGAARPSSEAVCHDGAPCGCDRVVEVGARDEAGAVRHFRALPGRGVQAEVDGRLLSLGRPDALGAADRSPHLAAAVRRLEREGKTVVVLSEGTDALGVIAVTDPLRPAAGRAVARLRDLGVRHILMLTGDNADTASAIAGEAGITDVRAGLLPADKLAAAVELRGRYETVMMVGDGVNDAPALAAATIGVAMGAAGTDAALETADVVLLGDELEAIPDTIALSRRTTSVIWQNIVFAIAVKALFLALAPLGLVTLWLAVVADMGTSLLVTANGLRLLRR